MEIYNIYRITREELLLDYIATFTDKVSNLQITALELLSNGFMIGNRYVEAIIICNQLVAHFPGTEHEKYAKTLKFYIHFNNREFEQANTVLEELIELYPEDEDVLISADLMESIGYEIHSAPKLAKQQEIPIALAISANYPNPFNPVTTIAYDLPDAAHVTLIVYDILGREVARLEDGMVPAGFRQAVWNGKDMLGREVPSGIYIARFVTPEYTNAIKMLLLK